MRPIPHFLGLLHCPVLEVPSVLGDEHGPPGSWLTRQHLSSPPRHRGPGRGWALGSPTSNWISTVPLSRPFFSCSMDPSKVSAPSGHSGKMASGKSWFSSSSDLISAKEWTAVGDKKGCVWLCGKALGSVSSPQITLTTPGCR